MSLNERDRREISDLASGAADGLTPEADRARLEEILMESQEAREYYLRFMNVSAGLAWAARADMEPAQAVPRAAAHRNAWWIATAAAAVLAFATLGTWVLTRPPAHVPPPAAGIATLSSALNVEWVDSQEPGHVGNMLKPGWVRIKSGLAQIDFLNGASVWLEGPVEFRLDSPREGYCASGKLVAQVPRAASDFSLATPNMTIADKGTGFGMEVTRGNRTAIHVFRGTVQVTLQSRVRTQLGAGQAMSVDHAGMTSTMSADPAVFSREEFASPFRPFGAPSPWTHGIPSHGPYMGPPPVIFPGQWKGADPMDPVRDVLGSNTDRWAVIKQPLEEFLSEQWRSWGLDNNVMEEKGVSRAKWALMFAVDDPNSSESELSTRLSNLREARAESRKNLEMIELKLRSLLTEEEQARLVSQGYIP